MTLTRYKQQLRKMTYDLIHAKALSMSQHQESLIHLINQKWAPVDPDMISVDGTDL